MDGPSFCYVQARVQSRHGERPGEGAWQALESARSFSHCLERARSGNLGRLTGRIGPADDGHTVELRLREARRAYVDEVAGWTPRPWRAAVGWCAIWPELPLLAYLLEGGDAWRWMARDPLLGPLTASAAPDRRERLKDMGWAPLLPTGSGQQARDIASGWLDHWRQLWPPCADAQRRQLDRLIAVVGRSFGRMAHAEAGSASAPLQRDLGDRLSGLFRAASPGPAAVICHLGLVALDFERLRGALLRRLLLHDGATTEAA
ncbi:MAG: hypothetical protein F9K29_22230 [Hyphomicrobiaceae bacterium]|nr:MAG: hypothetical protein F9K29_22230 [Hyphomicrobiaceae bacterium]